MGAATHTVRTWYDGPGHPGDKLPVGRIVRIEAEFILPARATRAEVLEWIKFEMGWGSMAATNPLSDHDLETNVEPTLTDTGRTTDRLRVLSEALEASVERFFPAESSADSPSEASAGNPARDEPDNPTLRERGE